MGLSDAEYESLTGKLVKVYNLNLNHIQRQGFVPLTSTPKSIWPRQTPSGTSFARPTRCSLRSLGDLKKSMLHNAIDLLRYAEAITFVQCHS